MRFYMTAPHPASPGFQITKFCYKLLFMLVGSFTFHGPIELSLPPMIEIKKCQSSLFVTIVLHVTIINWLFNFGRVCFTQNFMIKENIICFQEKKKLVFICLIRESDFPFVKGEFVYPNLSS